MATFASFWGGHSWQVLHQARYTHKYAYICAIRLWSDCAVFSSVYKARHYIDCVASMAEESMQGVVDTVKMLPEYSTSGKVLVIFHILIPSIIIMLG